MKLENVQILVPSATCGAETWPRYVVPLFGAVWRNVTRGDPDKRVVAKKVPKGHRFNALRFREIESINDEIHLLRTMFRGRNDSGNVFDQVYPGDTFIEAFRRECQRQGIDDDAINDVIGTYGGVDYEDTDPGVEFIDDETDLNVAQKRPSKKQKKKQKGMSPEDILAEREAWKKLPVTDVDGIGPVTKGELARVDVQTCAQLVDADPVKIAEATGNSQNVVIDWQEEAQRLIAKVKEESEAAIQEARKATA